MIDVNSIGSFLFPHCRPVFNIAGAQFYRRDSVLCPIAPRNTRSLMNRLKRNVDRNPSRNLILHGVEFVLYLSTKCF